MMDQKKTPRKTAHARIRGFVPLLEAAKDFIAELDIEIREEGIRIDTFPKDAHKYSSQSNSWGCDKYCPICIRIRWLILMRQGTIGVRNWAQQEIVQKAVKAANNRGDGGAKSSKKIAAMTQERVASARTQIEKTKKLPRKKLVKAIEDYLATTGQPLHAPSTIRRYSSPQKDK